MFSIIYTIDGQSTTLTGKSIAKLLQRAKAAVEQACLTSDLFSITGYKSGREIFSVALGENCVYGFRSGEIWDWFRRECWVRGRQVL